MTRTLRKTATSAHFPLLLLNSHEAAVVFTLMYRPVCRTYRSEIRRIYNDTDLEFGLYCLKSLFVFLIGLLRHFQTWHTFLTRQRPAHVIIVLCWNVHRVRKRFRIECKVAPSAVVSLCKLNKNWIFMHSEAQSLEYRVSQKRTAFQKVHEMNT
jgi:glycosyltransferase involved in cell wall biosynthesis